jgi:hypothetical protein
MHANSHLGSTRIRSPALNNERQDKMSTSPHFTPNIANTGPVTATDAYPTPFPMTPPSPPNTPRGGPRTEEGKANSSGNAITNGLYAARDFIRPSEEPFYTELTESLRAELAPSGTLEHNLVNEIRRAMWRLRRCGEVESHFVIALDDGSGFIFDPMESTVPDAAKVQLSVDRARSQSHRLLHKCTAELRKLQTERQFRNNYSEPGTDTPPPRPLRRPTHPKRSRKTGRHPRSGRTEFVL